MSQEAWIFDRRGRQRELGSDRFTDSEWPRKGVMPCSMDLRGKIVNHGEKIAKGTAMKPLWEGERQNLGSKDEKRSLPFRS